MKDIPLNEYKNISIKDDFDELCKMFGKTFPEDQKDKLDETKKEDNEIEKDEKKTEEEQIDLRFDKYIKIKEYQNSFETVYSFFQ